MTANLLEATRWFVVMTAELVALFLALSFLIVLLQAWVPEEKVRLMFEKRRPVGAYVGGAALGAITPFCSCSGIPVLAGLLRSGAPFGPTMAFLFASPLLDPVMLGVLVFLIGVEGTVAYAVITFLTSILVAALLSKLGLDSDVKPLGRAAAPGCKISPPARASVWRQAWRDTWAFFVPAVPYLLVGTP